jgi:hypothetical protein
MIALSPERLMLTSMAACMGKVALMEVLLQELKISSACPHCA